MQSVKADAALHSVQVGDQPVPGYRLVRRRGRGGFGEVWEAEAPGGFLVALKFVRLSTRCRSAELWALEVVRGIRHPNLLVSFGAWQVDDVLIVGMELADRSLGDRLLEATAQGLRGIPREELLGYLADVASAIDYLNSDRHVLEGRNGVGLQHRDLKPQNILLFGDGAKVADFGQSRILDRGDSERAGPCSLPYTAPECFVGQASRHSDQYSLAVTYCQLRGGRLPYAGGDDRVKAGHLSGTPDLEGLPEPERPIVARALAKRPEERWPDCQAFLAALRALGGTAVGSVPNILNGASSAGDWASRLPVAAESFAATATPADSDAPWNAGDEWAMPDDATDDPPSGLFEALPAEVVEMAGRPRPAGDAPRVAGFALRGGDETRSLTGRARLARAVALLLAASLALASPEVHTSSDRVDRAVLPFDMVEEAAASSQANVSRAAGRPESGTEEVGIDLGVMAASAESPASPGQVEEPILEPVEEPMHEPALELVPPSGKFPVALAVPHVALAPPAAAEEALAALIPSRTNRDRPVLDLPDAVDVRQGAARRMRVRIRRAGALGPVALRFTGLPRGVAFKCPEIPAGAEATDAVVSAGLDAEATVVEVGVIATLGAERAESRVQLSVLASPGGPYQLGRDHLSRGTYDRASAEFTEAIRLDPKHGWAYFYRAVATYLGGNPRKALDDSSEAIRLMPGSALVYAARGRIHYDMGSFEKALADYSEVIRLQPDNAIALGARGRIYDDLGKYDKALADCTEAIRLMPDDVAARYRRGLVRYHASDYAGATDDFTEVIRLDPKHAWAYRSRGDAHARLGDGTRAGADRDSALRLASAPVRPVSGREAVPLPPPPTAMPRERPTLKASPAWQAIPGPAGSMPLTRSRL